MVHAISKNDLKLLLFFESNKDLNVRSEILEEMHFMSFSLNELEKIVAFFGEDDNNDEDDED